MPPYTILCSFASPGEFTSTWGVRIKLSALHPPAQPGRSPQRTSSATQRRWIAGRRLIDGALEIRIQGAVPLRRCRRGTASPCTGCPHIPNGGPHGDELPPSTHDAPRGKRLVLDRPIVKPPARRPGPGRAPRHDRLGVSPQARRKRELALVPHVRGRGRNLTRSRTVQSSAVHYYGVEERWAQFCCEQ